MPINTILETAYENIKTILGNSKQADGYFFDWSANNIIDNAEDWILSQGKTRNFEQFFPLVELEWGGNSAVYNTKSAQSYYNSHEMNLKVYTFDDVTTYIQGSARARSDILKALGNNPSLNGAVEWTTYLGDELAFQDNRKAKPFAQLTMRIKLEYNFDQIDPERRC